jgi:hypothetical protein
MPKETRKTLVKQGVNTREGKKMMGKAVRQNRRERGENPNTGTAVTTTPAPEATSTGVAPRGANVERTRKTTTGSGKVGVKKTGMSSGPVGPEAYRNYQSGEAPVQQQATKPTGGKKPSRKVVRGKAPKAGAGRARGAIRNPNSGGAGKRLIASQGGGRRALATFRAQSKATRQALVAAGQQGNDITKTLRAQAKATTPKKKKR